MPHLQLSPGLQRNVRLDPIGEMGRRTEDWLISLIEARDDATAIEVAGYLFDEPASAIQGQVEVWTALWTWIADHLGEDELYATICDIAELDKWQQEHMARRHTSGRTMTIEEYARMHEAEHKRATRHVFGITEEPDRYKIVFNPCRTAKFRRLRDERGNPPPCVGRTREPHPWSWGRTGVPYLCTRIATAERLNIQKRGYPMFVTECAADDFSECVRYLYKDPHDIPAKYFEAVGLTRDPSKFKLDAHLRGAPSPAPDKQVIARLEYSEALGRPFRAEDWSQLGIYTEHKIQEAIRAGERQLAIDLTNYLDENRWVPVIHYPEIMSSTLTALAARGGEASVGDAIRWIPESTNYRADRLRRRLSTEEHVALVAEQRRAMRYEFHVEEESDRYVFVLENCNTGGRMARLRNEAGERYPAIGRTKQAYPWSWGRADVPYYCCQHAIMDEIGPIEQTGSPALITDCACGEGPCRQYVYKSPDLIPVEYFARVGCAKP